MTLQSPTPTLIPLFSSSELTGCGYPGLLDRKNHSDMCPRWESNPRLPACKASTSSTRPGSPLFSNYCRTAFLKVLKYMYINGCVSAHGYAIFVTLCKGGSLCDFIFTPLQNRAPFGIGSILGVMNLSRIQVLHCRNWSLFWKVVGKRVTEAASSIVCPFTFTYLNSAHVIITSSYIRYRFIIVTVIQKITLLQFFMVNRI